MNQPPKLRVLSLFSGIGAHDLGLEWAGMEIVGQIEIDEFCQKVLRKHWQDVPKWTDIRAVSDDDLRRLRRIDVITGGFPCQDISIAGKKQGLAGKRSSLFWEMHRIIRSVRPRFLLLENVPNLRIIAARHINDSGHGLSDIWATPTCNDAKNDAPPSQLFKRQSTPLNSQVVIFDSPQRQDEPSILGKARDWCLNPRWVSQLMGLPPDWLDVDDDNNCTH